MKRTTNNEPRITISFLGTNGWYDTDTGNTICVLIETPKEYVVLDAGNGLYKLDQYIKTDKPIHVFLSHFHLDHIEGLHILAKFRFKQGINLYVQKGGKKIINSIIRQPFTVALKDLKMRTKIFELSDKNRHLPFLVSALKLRHIAKCFGFRFNFGGKIISYVPDTGLCDNAFKLAKEADLLIAECAMKPGTGSDAWPHLDPVTAAEVAKKANARWLALVHFDAEIYKTLQERKDGQRIARKKFKNTVVATDGLEIKV